MMMTSPLADQHRVVVAAAVDAGVLVTAPSRRVDVFVSRFIRMSVTDASVVP
ncbi:MAG TPA: hypothetical protein VN626_05930 [Clostridia bacterium]|nr:hypothetical protein [Clostridia bacterium]